MPNPTSTCSINVVITNSTGQGSITFNSLDFLSSHNPSTLPPVVTNIVADGASAVNILGAYNYSWPPDPNDPDPPSSCSIGTAIFNLPNGDPLTISWSLNALSPTDNDMPSIIPSEAYNVTGVTTPVSDGYNFTFTLVISPQ
jgi:hypothetical protein